MKFALWQRRIVGTFIMASALALELAACGGGTVTTSGGTPGGGQTPIGAGGAGGGGGTLGGTVSLFAGSPTGASGVANGPATAAMFYGPIGITSDGVNLYVADNGNNQIRQISLATGVVTLLAGDPTGLPGMANGIGTAATFFGPNGITTDGSNLYVADAGNNQIRKIVLSTGAVSLLAGNALGASGVANGTGSAASFWIPTGIATDGTNLYVGDWGNNQVRQIAIGTGAVSLLAGSVTGASGVANGSGSAATFYGPAGMVVSGPNLYVADTGNSQIRQIVTASGAVTLFAGAANGGAGRANGVGTAAQFNNLWDISTDNTSLYVADLLNNEIRQVSIATAAVSLLAGSSNGTPGATNGVGTAAQFNWPAGIVYTGASLYVADYGNNQIRRIQ